MASALEVQKLVVGYGQHRVLAGVDLHVAAQQIVALIGHNGAGKSTLLKAIFGIIPLWEGGVRVSGLSVKRPSPRGMLSLGVGYLPQGQRVFGELTVQENLEFAGRLLGKPKSISSRVAANLERFPGLRKLLRRRAATLSGGEKQMVALASSLMLAPRVLLLDEPCLGLAAPLTENVFRHLRALVRQQGVSILIAEQRVREVLGIADCVYVLRNGAVSFKGAAEELSTSATLAEVYL